MSKVPKMELVISINCYKNTILFAKTSSNYSGIIAKSFIILGVFTSQSNKGDS